MNAARTALALTVPSTDPPVERAPLHASVDEGAVAAVVVDELGTIVEATTGAAAMLGFGPAQLRGQTLADMAAEGWSWVVQNALLRVVSGSLDPFELLLRGRSGRRTHVQMIPRPLVRGGDALQYLVVWVEQRSGASELPAATEAEAQLRRLAHGLLRTQENERSRVASELHDGVAPLVTMAKFMVEDALGRIARGATAEAVALLTNTVARLRDTLADVRRISTDLRPSSLDDLGLRPTIEWYCRQFGEAFPGIRVVCDLGIDDSVIPDVLKLDIFRIVQEALTNVGRHARATEVSVVMSIDDGRLRLRVEDNGLGFDTEPLRHSGARVSGVGLLSIRRRVDATGGELRLESSALRGTSLGAVWPVVAARQDAAATLE